jgi:hypothetical protein
MNEGWPPGIKKKEKERRSLQKAWSMIKCNKQSRYRNSVQHTSYTADYKNHKNFTCKIWKGRDHLGDLGVDGYRYNHSTPVSDETNSKTGLWTRGNVISIFNLISFTVWVVFKSNLILYGSQNTAKTQQVSHVKNNSGDLQSIPEHPKCFKVHSLQFGTPAVLAVPIVYEYGNGPPGSCNEG